MFRFIGDLDNAVRQHPPFMIGCSNYLWNIDLMSYNAVSAVKEKYPETIVVFGGPNYSDDIDEQINWLHKHPNVDLYIFIKTEKFLLPDWWDVSYSRNPSQEISNFIGTYVLPRLHHGNFAIDKL